MNIYLFQRLLGIGTLGMHIAIVAIVMLLIFKKNAGLSAWVKQHGYKIGFIFSFLSIVISLIFSDVYHIEPCKLCWLQRIFHYPQALIFLIAWKYDDAHAWMYSLWLSLFGLFFALKQIFLQFGVTDGSTADCVIGPGADCSAVHVMEFGYITFPVMSASLFLLLILLYVLQKKRQK